MKNKRPIIYLAVALVAALAVFIVERPNSPRVSDYSDAPLVPGFETDKVARVEVEQLMEGAQLKRDGDRWMVAEKITPIKKELYAKEGKQEPKEVWHLADASRVKGALAVFTDIEKGVIVSTNPDGQKSYLVDANTGLRVRAFGADETPIVDVVIGKGGPDFMSGYIRRSNEDGVHLVNSMIFGRFTPRAADWREHRLWSIDPDGIKAVEVQTEKGHWRMEKSASGEWKLIAPEEKPIDAAKAGEIVAGLANISASSFPDDTAGGDTGLDSPSMTVAIDYSDGKSAMLRVGGKNAAGLSFARLEGSEDVCLLSKDFVDKIPAEPPE